MSVEHLVLAQTYDLAALVNVLERKGVLTHGGRGRGSGEGDVVDLSMFLETCPFPE